MYTVIKQQIATRAEGEQGYEVKSNFTGAQPPRFDKAETLLREAQRKRGVERDGGYKPKKYPYVDPDFQYPKFEQLIKHHDKKQEFLKGDLAAVYYIPPEKQHFTFNRDILNGKQ